MRIAIVGGHGKVALQLHPLLVEAGHTPVALVRSDSYRSEVEQLGAEVGLLDIEGQDAAAFGEAFTGCDAVVFTAGGGADGNKHRKQTVDLEGTLKSIDGARAAGISRFVQVSAFGVDDPVADDASDVWQAYVAAKRDSDIAVRDSGLDWTILRPGGLTDGAGTGLIALAERLDRGQVPRADVAATIVAALADDRTIGQQWELMSGDVPIADAITAAITAG